MKQRKEDKGKSGIYLIRNLISGKVYIGKAKCIYKRIKQHVISLNKRVRSHENDHLISSWHKYGRNSFEYVVLEYLPLNESLISEKEIFYIDKYKSLNPKNGYNKRYDSSTGLIVSEETREKLRKSQIKRFENLEQRENLSLKSKEFWKNNPDKLKLMSEKVANKIRKYKIGKFDYDSEELIEVFETRKQIGIKYPEFYVQAILGCCQGTKNSYKGFKWKYISIETDEIINK
jgi:group I intron endonuclease